MGTGYTSAGNPVTIGVVSSYRNRPLVDAVAVVLDLDPDAIDPNHVIDLDVVDVTSPDNQLARRTA